MHQCKLLEPIHNSVRYLDVDECSVEVYLSKTIGLPGPDAYRRPKLAHRRLHSNQILARNQFSALEHDDELLEYPEDIFATGTPHASRLRSAASLTTACHGANPLRRITGTR
ncbi:hypothetical protein M405DRAFT_862199 [Rhizopogon salebrosus TDB-379]|nr:hypothetical protein M405DRAFT_862199 [Rhizopogon salebrosus TDB-379]